MHKKIVAKPLFFYLEYHITNFNHFPDMPRLQL